MTARDLPEAKIEIADSGGAYAAAATTAKPSKDDLQEAYDTLNDAILELYRLGFDGTANEATVALAALWAETTAPNLPASEASAPEGRKPNPSDLVDPVDLKEHVDGSSVVPGGLRELCSPVNDPAQRASTVEPAGVGEARPAEPPTDETDSVSALRKERGDARGRAEAWAAHVRREAALTRERDGLREQLDAARQALDAVAGDIDRLPTNFGRDTLRKLVGIRDRARAALGDVGEEG